MPFPPGGGTDGGARLIAQRLSEIWKQQAVIDNRAGAGGIVGVEIAARAKPDGYTLLVTNVGTQAINPYLYRKLPYDPQKDFEPISLIADLPIVLVTSPAFEARSVADLVKLAKADPGKYVAASSGTGNSTHLALEIFQTASGTRFLHVPYKGGGQANTDVIANHAQLQFTSVLGSTALIASGKFRALAVSSPTRAPALPDVPTLAEAGIPNAEMGSWVGVFAPAGTPAAIVDKVAADIRKAVASKEFQTTIIEQGAAPRSTTPAEFRGIIADDSRKFEALIKRLELPLQ